MPMPENSSKGHTNGMRDWAVEYLLHVLEAKDWSVNRLASESGVATSTLARPLREKDWPHKLSRGTIHKVREATGIDPSPFIPKEFSEERTEFARARPETSADRVLHNLDHDGPQQAEQPLNEIKIAVVGTRAQIVATIDRQGIAKLREKLNAIEAMLD